MFVAEEERLREALGLMARRIEHHGSTAVPGLGAKPIIDIQISVNGLQQLQTFATRLAGLGYAHVPSADDTRCPFFHRPAEWPHTYHLHLVEAGGEEEQRTLAFRDYLRVRPDVARDYEALKRELAHRFDGRSPDDREAYAVAKTEFVTRVTELALGCCGPRKGG
jgi:GrpB-like predicted nucleotidyltransferase (UPF0157 family)